MTDIISSLREFFTPNNERLLGALRIIRSGGKKKKLSYICVSGLFVLYKFMRIYNYKICPKFLLIKVKLSFKANKLLFI